MGAKESSHPAAYGFVYSLILLLGLHTRYLFAFIFAQIRMGLRLMFIGGFSFFLFSSLLFGGTSVDSLRRAADSRLNLEIRDSKTAEMCISLARLYFHDNSRDFFSFTSHAIQIATELKNYQILSKGYTLLGNKYKRMGALGLALKSYHTGLDASIHSTSAVEIVYTLSDIGNIYYGKKMFDMAAKYYRRGLAFENSAKEIIHPLSVIYINLGLINLQKSQHDSAMINFRKAYNLRVKLNNKFYLAHSKYYFGRAYQVRGEYDSALYYFNASLAALDDNIIRNEYTIEIFEFKEDCIYAIIDVYTAKGNKEKTLSLLQNLLDDRYSYGTASAQKAYLRYSAFLTAENDFAGALDYLNMALELSDSLGLTGDRLDGLVKKANLLEKLNRQTEAVNVYKEYTLLNDSLTSFTVSSDLGTLADKQELEMQDDKMRELISSKEKEILVTTLTRDLLVISFLLAAALIFVFYRKYRVDNNILLFLRTLINSLPYPFYVVNTATGQIDYNNDATETELGHLQNLKKQENAINYTGDLNSIIAELSSGKALLRKYFEVLHPGDIKRHYESSNFAVYDSTGKITSIIEYIRDISQIKEAENQLKQYTSELEQSNISKDRLISIIAHDLKNPFGVLLGSLNILKDNYYELNDEEKTRFISNLRDAAVRVYMLVENLLDWSILNAGRVVYSPVAVRLAPLLRETSDPFLLEMKLRNIKLIKNYPEDIEIFADQYMLRTIVRNLLSNAIKFTPDDGVVSISARAEDDCAVISIADSGIGLNEDDISKLFRADIFNSEIGSHHAKKGTGLGLIVCHEFIKLNKGIISVSGEPGLGSEFTFTIPLAGKAEVTT